MSIIGCMSSGPGDLVIFNILISPSTISSVMKISNNKDSVTLPREGMSLAGSIVNTLVNCFWIMRSFSSSPNLKHDLSFTSSSCGETPYLVFSRYKSPEGFWVQLRRIDYTSFKFAGAFSHHLGYFIPSTGVC